MSADELLRRLPPIGSESVARAGASRRLAPEVSELALRIQSGVELTDAQWLAALFGSEAIRLRESWPADRPYAVSLRKPRWLPDDSQITLSARRPLGVTATCGQLVQMHCGLLAPTVPPGLYEPLGLLVSGRQRLEFDIEVATGRGYPYELDGTRVDGELLWQGAFWIDCDVVKDVAQVLTPVDSPDIAAAVRAALTVKVWGYGGRRYAQVGLDPARPVGSALEGVALSVCAEFMRTSNGATVAVEPYGEEDEEPGVVGCAWIESETDSRGYVTTFDPSAWTLRVVGTDADVLEDWSATRYWDGELVVPVSELRAHD